MVNNRNYAGGRHGQEAAWTVRVGIEASEDRVAQPHMTCPTMACSSQSIKSVTGTEQRSASVPNP